MSGALRDTACPCVMPGQTVKTGCVIYVTVRVLGTAGSAPRIRDGSVEVVVTMIFVPPVFKKPNCQVSNSFTGIKANI